MKANEAYQVFNIRTGEYVASRATRKSAQRLADKLDLEYGAINYTVKQNYDDKSDVLDPLCCSIYPECDCEAN